MTIACRILTRWRMCIDNRHANSITEEEIEQLRSFAQSEEERSLPVDDLARLVVQRERNQLAGPDDSGVWEEERAAGQE